MNDCLSLVHHLDCVGSLASQLSTGTVSVHWHSICTWALSCLLVSISTSLYCLSFLLFCSFSPVFFASLQHWLSLFPALLEILLLIIWYFAHRPFIGSASPYVGRLIVLQMHIEQLWTPNTFLMKQHLQYCYFKSSVWHLCRAGKQAQYTCRGEEESAATHGAASP